MEHSQWLRLYIDTHSFNLQKHVIWFIFIKYAAMVNISYRYLLLPPLWSVTT